MVNSNCTPRLAFIGGGNMASAIINGFIDMNEVLPGNIIVYDKDIAKYHAFEEKGVKCVLSLKELSVADYVFICVKPYHVSSVTQELLSTSIPLKDKTFVSICAGVPISFIYESLGGSIPVVRIMPSTPMLVGLGAAAISKNELVSKKKFEYLCRILSSIATVGILEEDKMNTVIAVNGSSPAYVYLFVKSMLDAAVNSGISAETALPLILTTVEGSVKMIRQTGKDIDTLIKDVSSPHGTTLEALKVFEDRQFSETIADAMEACTRRANEITEEIISK